MTQTNEIEVNMTNGIMKNGKCRKHLKGVSWNKTKKVVYYVPNKKEPKEILGNYWGYLEDTNFTKNVEYRAYRIKQFHTLVKQLQTKSDISGKEMSVPQRIDG